MAVDSSLMYWDMAVSFLLHLAGPLAVATIFSGVLESYSLSTRVWILIFATVVYSFIVNFGALLFLQATSCDGLKDAAGVAKGAGISAAITLFFAWIPSIWEGLRLSISQLFMEHHPLLTAADAARQGILVSAGKQIIQTYATPPAPEGAYFPGPPPSAVPTNEAMKQGGGARMTVEEYDNQTFSEIKVAMAYMAAFAGAYGVGIGSRYAVNCKKV